MKIVIVEDRREDVELLCGYIDRYFGAGQANTQVYENGMDFVEHYAGHADLVLMDIAMPHINGMEAAVRLRETDPFVCLVFITNMVQYAVKSYEVNALDFLLKPVGYPAFEAKMRKVQEYIGRHRMNYIWLPSEDGEVKVAYSQIRYIEKQGNYLVYHTEQGNFRQRGAMKDVEARFESGSFARCINGCLVNLDRVVRIGKTSVVLDDVTLPIGRRDRAAFMEKLMDYYGN